jgi:DNA-binding NarL/FixJ family response regulator
MKDELRILIADDHPIFRRGLRQVIESNKSLKVVAETEDGITAIEQIELQNPDIAVLDIHMPDMSGLDVVRAIQQKGLAVEMIVLTMYKDEEIFNTAMDLGVKGYMLKDNAVTDVINCLKAVAAGRPYITPSLSHYLIDRCKRAALLLDRKDSLSSLTPTERRVLKLIAEYKTSKQIAGEMFIHPRTVDNHRNNICAKLNIHGTHALLKFALEHKSSL